MLRFKTLFGRMLATYMLIALFTVVLLAVMTTQILRWNTVNSTEEQLLAQTESINDLIETHYTQGQSGEELVKALTQRAVGLGIEIWITDRFNTVLFSPSGDAHLAAYQEILMEQEPAFFDQTQQGNKVRSVYYDNTFVATPVITAAAPLTISSESGENNVVGSVFLHKRLNDFETYMSLLYRQLIVCGVLSAALAFVLLFFMSKKIQKPLFAINAAARELAQGNFKKRVEVTEYNEIGQLAQTFNELTDELERYENTQASFVANVSHELRSPLTSIQGLVQGMLDGTIPEEDQKQYLEIVLHESKRLSTLTRDLLELAKTESGQFPLRLTTYDINEQIRRCFIGFLGKIEDKNLEITVDLPEEKTLVVADEDRIAQVLTNLMDNAVKFCCEEGQFKIWTYNAGSRVFVNILNTGATIPAEDIPFVFERFFKVDKSHNRQSPGSGIGLSLVRSILLQHGEEVSVASDPANGTVFTFSLKRAEEAKPEAQEAQSENKPPKLRKNKNGKNGN